MIELVEAIISVYAEYRVLHMGWIISFIPKYLLLNNSKTVIDCGVMPLQSTKDDFVAFSLIAHFGIVCTQLLFPHYLGGNKLLRRLNWAQTAPSACNRQAT